MSSRPDAPSWGEAWKHAWERFWFTPADPRPLALARIVVGLAALAYLASFSPDLDRWFSPQPLLSSATSRAIETATGQPAPHRFSLLRLAGSSTELWILHAAFLAAATMLTAGLATRLSAAATLLGVLSYVHGAPAIATLLDAVLSFSLLYLCLAPAGGWWSLDRVLKLPRWLRGSDQPSVSARIALRLMQVHLVAIYFVLGAAKLYGDAWWDGEAIWFLMAQTHSRPADLSAIRNWELLLNAWTHLVAFSHLSFAALVWNRLTRPIVLALAVFTWLSLIPVTGQTILCLTMAALCSIYLPPPERQLNP